MDSRYRRRLTPPSRRNGAVVGRRKAGESRLGRRRGGGGDGSIAPFAELSLASVVGRTGGGGGGGGGGGSASSSPAPNSVDNNTDDNAAKVGGGMAASETFPFAPAASPELLTPPSTPPASTASSPGRSGHRRRKSSSASSSLSASSSRARVQRAIRPQSPIVARNMALPVDLDAPAGLGGLAAGLLPSSSSSSSASANVSQAAAAAAAATLNVPKTPPRRPRSPSVSSSTSSSARSHMRTVSDTTAIFQEFRAAQSPIRHRRGGSGHSRGGSGHSRNPSSGGSDLLGGVDYNDRYIPSRTGSNLGHGMSTPNTPEPSSPSAEASQAGQRRSRSAAALDDSLWEELGLGGSPIAAAGRSTPRRQGSTQEPASPRDTSGSPRGAAPYQLLLQAELLGTNGELPSDTPMPVSPSGSAVRSPTSRAHQPRTLRFQANKRQHLLEDPYSVSPVASDNYRVTMPSRRAPRKISKFPFKVLDAPSLKDDFYLNLVDWSSQNVLAVGLDASVYLWSACTSKVVKLCDVSTDVPGDFVTSVCWSVRGSHLAIGTKGGFMYLWDGVACKKVRDLQRHSTRVGSLAFATHALASGSRDRTIRIRDPRSDNDVVQRKVGHKQEVCGLKWSFDERTLASGGNDNHLLIWNVDKPDPLQRFEDHTAAVKAIAWSPHQHGLLASGGGTADRCIRFWNTLNGTAINCIDTGSQVCNLAWSKNVNEFVSTHGYSLNQIIVWKYPSLQKLATLTGHSYRVLYLSTSPDGQSIVTGAGDETLRFWNVFPSSSGSKGRSSRLFSPATNGLR